MKPPKRTKDVRIEVTHRVFGDVASRYHIRKGTILDGAIDPKTGNFVGEDPRAWLGEERGEVEIFPTHFKILGRFYFRRAP